nr:taste receptor type 2 member 41-like [Chrysemys picta bellii]
MLPVIIICLIILGIEFITGIIANGLIEWIRSRKLTCCDMILTSLGISRFFLQWTIFINNILFALSPVMNGLCDIRRNLYIFWMYLNTLSLWFATWLSVFYCVKIGNFSQPLFLWLKRRISGLVPLLLMGSWLVSLVTCLPLVKFIERKFAFWLMAATPLRPGADCECVWRILPTCPETRKTACVSSKEARIDLINLVSPENKPNSQRCNISVHGARILQDCADELESLPAVGNQLNWAGLKVGSI